MADLTTEEYRELILLPRDGKARREAHARATHSEHEPSAEELKNLPSYVNWADKGAVTAVQDQVSCVLI